MGSSYYNHKEIPFLIVVAEFWLDELITKRIFVVTSNHNKQDVHYVLDSLNYILSLNIFSSVETIFLVSDNASNLKNGYDFFNLFSENGPLSGRDKKKKLKFIRIFSWFVSFLFLHHYFSPHHGKGIANAFGGEYRKRMENYKMKNSIYNFETFFEACQTEFGSKNSPPGSKRVTFLRFVFIYN
jgi:hypothetical protein